MKQRVYPDHKISLTENEMLHVLEMAIGRTAPPVVCGHSHKTIWLTSAVIHTTTHNYSPPIVFREVSTAYLASTTKNNLRT